MSPKKCEKWITKIHLCQSLVAVCVFCFADCVYFFHSGIFMVRTDLIMKKVQQHY